VEVQRQTPAALARDKTAGTHCGGGHSGAIVGLDGCGKSRPHPDSIPGPAKIKNQQTQKEKHR